MRARASRPGSRQKSRSEVTKPPPVRRRVTGSSALRVSRRAKRPSTPTPEPTYVIRPTAKLEPRENIHIGHKALICDYVIIHTPENPVVIGAYCQINPFTVIYGGTGVYIGDNVMIAPHCMIAAGDHDFKQLEKPIRFAGSLSKGPIVIEDNVWIGANCTLTDGVRIGRDAVVGAGSVVTRDVAPFDIVAGVPARVIGNRKTLAKRAKRSRVRHQK